MRRSFESSHGRRLTGQDHQLQPKGSLAMISKLKHAIGAHCQHKLSSAPTVESELLERSRVARIGHRLVQGAVLIHAFEAALSLALLVAIAAAPALAQTPGGNVFGGDQEQLGRSLREVIKWGRNILFLMGIAGIGW